MSKKRSRDDQNARDQPNLAKRPRNLSENQPPRVKSSLVADDVDFPRGGGTNMTAVEYKSLKKEAMKEVADELFKEGVEKKSTKPKAKHSKKPSTKGKEKEVGHEIENDHIRVEFLNYKRLLVGTKVLCVVTKVSPLALVVSLPNLLIAHIPLTGISPLLTQQLDERMETSEEEEDEESEVDSGSDNGSKDVKPSKEGNGPLNLTTLFQVGQYIRAVVTAVHPQRYTGGVYLGAGVDKAARRVELSMSPEQVNAGITKADLTEGFTLPAVIKSIEDHGYILDFGLSDISGFLSFKNAKVSPPQKGKKLEVGSVVECAVKKLMPNGRTCDVTVDPAVVKTSLVSEASSIKAVLAGSLVQALVTAVLPNGLNLQILGFYEGTVDTFHIKPNGKYKAGQKVKARILYDVISTTPHRFALTLLPHLISLDARHSSPKENTTIQSQFPVGTVIDDVKVVSAQSGWGLTCEVTEGVYGFAHISQVSDVHVESLPETSGQWKIGTIHRARIMSYSALDGLLQLTFRESVIDEKILRVSDLQVGVRVTGTVVELTETHLRVKLSEGVTATVFPLHYADITLKNPQKRFKPGVSVKARVLRVDAEQQRVQLTLKKTLVQSDLPIISKFEDAKLNILTHAVVCRLMEKTIAVELFGGLRALVPAKELDETPVVSVQSRFKLGQLVKIRVFQIDNEERKLLASIKRADLDYVPPPTVDDVGVEDVLNATISEIQKDNVVVKLAPSGVTGLLAISNLARHRDTGIAAIKSTINAGDLLTELVVVSKNEPKNFVIVAYPPKPKSTNKEDASGSAVTLHKITIDTVKLGQILPAYVIASKPFGSLVRIGKYLSARLFATDVSDDYTSEGVKAFPDVDSLFNVAVVNIDKENKIVDVSCRASRLRPADKPAVVDKEVQRLEDLKLGDTVRGFVKNIKNGLFVIVGRDIDAKVQIKELFDEYIKDWESRFQLHQVVKGKIIKLDAENRQIELTFRSGDRINAKSAAKRLGWNDFKVHQKVDGLVKAVENYGLFVEIKDSNVSGLCHKSELSDNKEADVSRALEGFQKGDLVRAKILTLEPEKRRISFGLKPSYFEDDIEMADVESEDQDEDLDEPEDDEFLGIQGGGIVANDEQDHDQSEDDSDESEEQVVVTSSVPAALRNEQTEQTGQHSQQVAAPKFEIKGGLKWSMAELNEENTQHASDDDTSEDEPNTYPGKSKKKSKKKIQLDHTADMHNKAPESTSEFERMLRTTPNSSFLWIQYMSFQLQLSEIEKAKTIGRRALSTIGFREEQEKMNVWIALLNLEVTYGTEESVEGLFKEAAQANDSKSIHLRFASILDEAQMSDKAEEIYKRATKKFGGSAKVWTLFGEHYLKLGKLEDSRQLLPRSLQSLEKRKHLKVISKFAQLEYRLGQPERGRTIFEGIITSHPKKYDQWSIYIDMEAKQGDIGNIRGIFERVFLQKLSTKKAKFFFKKWLALEKSIGDEAGAEAVKSKAVEWTEQNMKAGDT
ncbi:rRNA biogenesis protein rrp5 [Tulasnella sp. 418]|nr:rRNA biogenesis protein rrp5 [Tulasnella sp. 418]